MSCDSLRARLEARLDPVGSWSPERTAIRSDYDLNPGAARPTKCAAPMKNLRGKAWTGI